MGSHSVTYLKSWLRNVVLVQAAVLGIKEVDFSEPWNQKYAKAQEYEWKYDPMSYTGDVRYPYEHPVPFAHPNANDYKSRTNMVPLVAPFVNATYIVSVFSLSYSAVEANVEEWFRENESPARHNPLRVSSVFNSVGIAKDELDSSCIGFDFKIEVCIQSIDCISTSGYTDLGRYSSLRTQNLQSESKFRTGSAVPLVWIPSPVVAGFRVEAVLIPDGMVDQITDCKKSHARSLAQIPEKEGQELLKFMTQWAGMPLHHEMYQSGFKPLDRLEFTLPYIDGAAAWWAKYQLQNKDAAKMMRFNVAQLVSLRNGDSRSIMHGNREKKELELEKEMQSLHECECWMELMRETLQHAIENNSQALDYKEPERGLFAEFGVASGKSLAFISENLKKVYGQKVVVHGFDSFVGIPEAWNNLQAATFTMEGKVPEILKPLKNIKIHMGFFNETKNDVDNYEFVSFLHMDMDIYPAAREVLLHFACRFVPGTILIFDELINYPGWSTEGEFLALQEVSSLAGLSWQPLGFYHEQSVPVVITENRMQIC